MPLQVLGYTIVRSQTLREELNQLFAMAKAKSFDAVLADASANAGVQEKDAAAVIEAAEREAAQALEVYRRAKAQAEAKRNQGQAEADAVAAVQAIIAKYS